MTKKNILRKALDTIALNHSQGNVPNDFLIKACENYKSKVNFIEDLDYDLIVAKSCFDYINGVEQDSKICKAIVPGQTKMVDGVMYIYTATPNAKTPYDWRVVKKGAITGKSVGRGDKLDAKKVDDKQKFINSLFPKDLSTLKVIKQLGGSTGAQLVEDVNGNQYVMKRGTNTSSAHVQAEYMANQIYDALGQRVPDYELYDDNGTAVLLSRFIPMTRVPNSSDHPKMAEGFIADVILANWDVYQNDNCLIDSAGRVIRVDNGGSLSYRARGASKPYNSDVVKTYKDMIHHNPSVFGNLSDDDVLKQIADVQARKDTIVGFLLNTGATTLAKIVGDRIDNLNQITTVIQAKKNRGNIPIKPRTLKSDADMYRELDDTELDRIWKAQYGTSHTDRLYHIGSSGWNLLSDICKERGFDARPRVVDETTFWTHVASLPPSMQMFRGIADDPKTGGTAEQFVTAFKHNDACFYGSIGIYGEGIYAHVNDGKSADVTKAGCKNSKAYKDAVRYAGQNPDGVLSLAWEKGAKVAKVDDLIKEIRANPPVAVNVKPLEKERDKIKAELDKVEEDIKNIGANTEKAIKASMHFDEQTVSELQLMIESTDWGAVDDDGNPDYPSWADFVEKDMVKWITSNGGTIKHEKGQITFTLPNSKQSFTLTRYQYENNAIKQRNAFTPAYNYPIMRFEDWFVREHIQRVDKAVKEAVDGLGDAISKLQTKQKDLAQQYKDKVDEITKKSNPDPMADVYAAIYTDVTQGHCKEAVGIYAALKGYDGLYQPNGNGSGHGFAIILNRSKIVCLK